MPRSPAQPRPSESICRRSIEVLLGYVLLHPTYTLPPQEVTIRFERFLYCFSSQIRVSISSGDALSSDKDASNVETIGLPVKQLRDRGESRRRQVQVSSRALPWPHSEALKLRHWKTASAKRISRNTHRQAAEESRDRPGTAHKRTSPGR